MDRPLIMFDFDGVLVDSTQVCYELTKLDFPHITIEQYRDLFLGNVYESLQKLRVQGQPNTQLSNDDFFKLYDEHMRNHQLVAGMNEVLMELNARAHLSIVSSAYASVIERILAREQAASYFFQILGAETERNKTKKILNACTASGCSTQRALFITDTAGDIREATQAGVQTIAVSWGVHNAKTLQDAQPHAIVHSPDELLQHVKKFYEL